MHSCSWCDRGGLAKRDGLYVFAGAVLLTAVGACAEVLGLESAILADACATDADCPPMRTCSFSSCVSSECNPGEKACRGLVPYRCKADQAWEAGPECDALCRAGECQPPPSCESAQVFCGADQASCCKSIVLPRDGTPETYLLSYEYELTIDGKPSSGQDVVERTVRPFMLDRFEVTFDRFLEFWSAFDDASRPSPGRGAHPAFPDSGWQQSWSDNQTILPPSPAELMADLVAHGQPPFDAEQDRTLPIRGVSWYVALAFCIWDHGRLPTEAEWAYAAQGGNAGFLYAWPNDQASPIEPTQATYSQQGNERSAPTPVGSHGELGRGAFGHDDLTGNLSEWVFDTYQPRLAKACENPEDRSLDAQECLERRPVDSRVLRGGAYLDDAEALRNVVRSAAYPTQGRAHIGFRCARDPTAE